MADGHDRAGFPRGAVARPLGILALGILASAALWAVLLRDGGGRAQTEHLTQRDRAALDRVLQHP